MNCKNYIYCYSYRQEALSPNMPSDLMSDRLKSLVSGANRKWDLMRFDKAVFVMKVHFYFWMYSLIYQNLISYGIFPGNCEHNEYKLYML